MSPSPSTNKAGESWCMAGDPCIIWRPFPRAGFSSSSTGRTSVTQWGWPWRRDPGQTSPRLAVHYPARNWLHKPWNRAVSLREDSRGDDRHDLLFMLSLFIWWHAVIQWIIWSFSLGGFLPCSFRTEDNQGGDVEQQSHSFKCPKYNLLQLGNSTHPGCIKSY